MRPATLAFGLIAGAALTLVVAAGVHAATTSSSSAIDLATRMESVPGLVTGASWVNGPGQGAAVSTSSINGFPTDGADFAILGSGLAMNSEPGPQSNFESAPNGAGSFKGANDAISMRVDLVVPDEHNCLALDARFLSEEYPEYVGSNFNDAFISELDASTWTVSGGTVNAPDTFAFDSSGVPVTINQASMSAGNGVGTPFDGATDVLSAYAAAAPGPHSVYLTIFDASDGGFDSAVFIDNLRTLYVQNSAYCRGIVETIPLTVDAGPAFSTKTGVPVTLAPVIMDGIAPYSCMWTSPTGATFTSPTACAVAPTGATAPTCGTHSLLFTVTDAEGTTLSDLTSIDVYCPPTAVVFIDDSPHNCLDSRVRFYAMGSRDNDPFGSTEDLTYSWTISNGATFTGPVTTGSTYGPGVITVTLTVTDTDATVLPHLGATATVSKTFTAMGDPPCPPAIDPIPDRMMPLGTTLRFTVTGSDPEDPQGLYFVFDGDFPGATGATMDPITGAFEWTPEEVGRYCGLTVTLSDRDLQSASDTFCITVYVPTIDSDQDGAFDGSDNCPANVNTGQADSDHDGIGDACDNSDPASDDESGDGASPTGDDGEHGEGTSPPAPLAGAAPGGSAASVDQDNDGIADASDDCPTVPNALQGNLDQDVPGDACDDDADGDGVAQSSPNTDAWLDNCPTVVNAGQDDLDGNFVGDACQGLEVPAMDTGLAPATVDVGAASQETDQLVAGPTSQLGRCRTQSCSTVEAAPTAKAWTESPVVGGLLVVASVMLVGGLVVVWAVRRW